FSPLSGHDRLKDTSNSLNPIKESLVPEEDNDINAEPTSYVRATSASTKDQTKAEANFRSLMADKVFDDVNISIPRNVVEKEDVISLISTHLGKPIMPDSYTSVMCKDSWGRSGFTRCLIEIKSEADHKDSITIGIPDLEDVNKKHNNKRNSASNMLPKGVPVVKGFQVGKDFAFQPKAPKAGSNGGGTHSEVNSKAESSKNTKEGASLTEQESHVDVPAVYDTCKKVCKSNLVGHAGLMRNRPWVLMGDFNAALNLEDHSSSGYEPNVAMRDFKECVQAMEVSDVDWSFAIFQPYHISDHSPCVLRIPTVSKHKPKPFKFANFLVYKKGFCEVVEYGRNANIEGFAMYQVNRIRIELDETQKAIDKDPSSSILREEHAHYLLAFKEAQLDEERFLKQKAKVEGLKAGDSNTTYFHRIVKSKCARNKIDMVNDSSNTLYDGNQDVIDIEVKNVIFSMGDDKAPSPDGFNAAFFKKAWDVVGGDITSAIKDFFFSNGKLLKELNHTIIALIPKLMRNYHRRRIPPRCAFKDDIQKAYDTVDWKFLKTILVCFGFHPKMVQWIMVCVSGASYSICVNGNLHGWFKGKRDDLFLFARGHPNSVSVIIDDLEEFKQVSGLVPSILKSTTFFCNVPNAIKASILNPMPFAEGEMKKGKAKAAWDSVYMPKHEGGLGIRRINEFNVHTYKLNGRSYWDVPCRGDASWGWHKLLQIRSTIRPFIWHKINNGKSTSVWFDRWADVCPLKDMLFNRDIARLGFSLNNSVSNLISDGAWRWPPDWLSRFPSMAQLHVPLLLDDMDDVILWRDRDDDLLSFSMACQKLKTQDRLRQWDVGPSIDLNLLRCPLCELVPDSHDHLFFECSFSSQVWSQVRVLCGIDSISPQLGDVIAFIIPISKAKWSIVFSLGSWLLLLLITFG
ncbi:zinc knuckle CX2CX4HX4C containing protein, partial [Tanacetum coccineum]